MTRKADDYVTAEQALELIPFPLGRSNLVRMSKTGAFAPVAVRVNKRILLWLRADVEKWIAEKSPRGKRCAVAPSIETISIDLSDLQWRYKFGMSWAHCGVNATKTIVAQLRQKYARHGVIHGVILDLDESDACSENPKNLIITVGFSTRLLPLKFKKRIVHIGSRVAHVSHPEGVAHLFHAIKTEIEKVLKDLLSATSDESGNK